jgi:hypothetical protein
MKLYLYMDNYSGHTGRDSTKFWPSAGTGRTREWNLQGLKEAGCASLRHNGKDYAITDLLNVKKGDKRKGWPNATHIIALGREWMWGNKPENALSAVEAAALADGECQIIFSVPMTPDANPIEYWWGTAKGFLGDLYDGDVSCDTIARRWREIAVMLKMIMGGVSARHPALEDNPVCKSYIDHGLRYTTKKLAPLSTLAACGELGKYDLSKADGAQGQLDVLNSSPLMYYRLWRECEGLSLAPPGEAELPGGDEEAFIE